MEQYPDIPVVDTRAGLTRGGVLMNHVDWSAARHAAVRRCRFAGASVEDAEDCAQEALVALHAKLREPGDEIGDATSWLIAVAHRRYLDLCRRRTKERSLEPRHGEPAAPGPDVRVVAQSEAVRLLTSLSELPATTQQVCHSVAGGHSVTETANTLALSRRSVEAHLFRARLWLKRVAALAAAALCFPSRNLDSASLGSAKAMTTITALAASAATVIAVLSPGLETPSAATPPVAAAPSVDPSGTAPEQPTPRSDSATTRETSSPEPAARPPAITKAPKDPQAHEATQDAPPESPPPTHLPIDPPDYKRYGSDLIWPRTLKREVVDDVAAEVSSAAEEATGEVLPEALS